MKWVAATLLGFSALLVLNGCHFFLPTPYVMLPVKAYTEGGELYFSFEQKTGARVTIYSIGLSKNDCETDCDYWQTERKVYENGVRTSVLLASDKVRYGEAWPELHTLIPAKPLTPGSYSASGIARLENDIGKTFFSDFEIAPGSELKVHDLLYNFSIAEHETR